MADENIDDTAVQSDDQSAQPETQEVAASMSATPANIDWPNWLFRCNFVNSAALLAKIPLGAPDEESLRAIAGALDTYGPLDQRSLWSFDQPAEEWSLFGVEILYNGKNQNSFPTLSVWKNCIKIKWPAYSVNPPAGSELYMCWANPPATAKAE